MKNRINDVFGRHFQMSAKPLYKKQRVMDEVNFFVRDVGLSLCRIQPGLRAPNSLHAYELDGIFFRQS